ncbi:MAG TPA: NAD(P)H-dependent glycerol-3-phosphate dehydrogenase [Peptococcaceae bacterium]|nr:NAD(P)H-dependent glycerol-3-phosphate dehydrogenase [Peptococcaceae bacterium]
MSKVSVLGAGSWGTALAITAARNGHQVTLWGRSDEKLRGIQETRENKYYLPDVLLPDNILATSSLEKTVKEADAILLVVPSTQIRSICRQIRPYLQKGQLIINTAKGIEVETLERLSVVIEEELAGIEHEFCFLSGPSHAEEVGRGMPTAIVASSHNRMAAAHTQDLLMSTVFRIYTNTDLLGVELAAALKNAIALGIGIAIGLGYGDNTMAALITRGLAEVSRMGIAAGADPATFAGLAGVGDLIVTCASKHSRNRKAGVLLGQGHKLDQVLQEVGMVVEGIRATEAAEAMSRKYNVPMPICHEIYQILFQDKPAQEAVGALMGRSKKDEHKESPDFS